MLTQAPKGTHDVLPSEVHKWQYIESVIADICQLYGYKEIRTPVFEHTELFQRGVGDTTDIVQKEMYTFEDKGGRSITLRPEGTAGAVRSYIQSGMANLPHPIKLYYLVTCYRYENVQKGRYREHNQFGVEAFGAAGPSIDVEIISILHLLFNRLGIHDLTVNINSIGCPRCRPAYHKALKEYLGGYLDQLCDTCKERYERNPMRIIDCKVEGCKKIAANAPAMIDYLCDECRDHFEGLKRGLSNLNIPFDVDPTIVRGQDYYTKTVFEFVSHRIGAQGTVCGGGRYDGLIEVCGGKPTPGIGFGLGIERLIMEMESRGIAFPEPEGPDLYIAALGEDAGKYAEKAALMLRQEGISVDYDHMGRSLKAQMKYADKLGVRLTLVVGEEELARGAGILKNMKTGDQLEIPLDNLQEKIKEILPQAE